RGGLTMPNPLGATSAAHLPLSQLIEKATAADQAAKTGAPGDRGQPGAAQGAANNPFGGGAAQVDRMAGQAAQRGGASLPGNSTPQVTTNTPAAIGPCPEIRPGSSAYRNPFAQ